MNYNERLARDARIVERHIEHPQRPYHAIATNFQTDVDTVKAALARYRQPEQMNLILRSKV